jgi:hypothetical protein
VDEGEYRASLSVNLLLNLKVSLGFVIAFKDRKSGVKD